MDNIVIRTVKSHIPNRLSIRARGLLANATLRINELIPFAFAKSSKEYFRVIPLSVSEYCNLNGIDKYILEQAESRCEYTAPFFELSESCIIESDTPEIYYAKLESVDVIGAHDAILSGNRILNDKFELRDSDKMDFETKHIFESKDGLFCVAAERGEYIPEAISLIGAESHNYYHWVFDILAKMAYINLIPELESVPILIDECVINKETYMGLYHAVSASSHPIITVKSGVIRKVGLLHYVSFCTFSNVYCKYPYDRSTLVFVHTQKVIDMYKSTISHALERSRNDYPKKVFISRGNGAIKRLVNEDEVASVCKTAGFTIIDPESYSIDEQIALFNNADWIIGDEGAAFSNRVFAGNKTMLVCIMPKQWGDRQFSTIAYLAKVNCINLDARDLEYGRYHAIDISYLERFLQEVNKKS